MSYKHTLKKCAFFLYISQQTITFERCIKKFFETRVLFNN